ncbi:MAG: hypothetical protein HY537_16155 [Deltaproteobacteria bacterium]|nr:hypothetical protein [Deltaproteobacteria bacterium]
MGLTSDWPAGRGLAGARGWLASRILGVDVYFLGIWPAINGTAPLAVGVTTGMAAGMGAGIEMED